MSVALPSDRSRVHVFDGLKSHMWIDLNGGGLPQPILVRLARTPEGSLACTGLIIGAFGDEEITPRDLRGIRLGEILANFSSLLAAHKKNKATRELGRVTIGDLLEASAEGEVRSAVHRPGPRGRPREHFERVAEDYRAALVSHPRSPIKQVAYLWSVNEATVHRWLERCLELGIDIPGKHLQTPKGKQKRRGGK